MISRIRILRRKSNEFAALRQAFHITDRQEDEIHIYEGILGSGAAIL